MAIMVGVSIENLMEKLHQRIWAYEVNLMGLEKNLLSGKDGWAKQQRRREAHAILTCKLAQTEDRLARLQENKLV